MDSIRIAYRLRGLFEQKITAEYYASFSGHFGRVQIELLSYLYQHGKSRTQDLAQALSIPKQHASKIILRLIVQGLIESSEDPSDGRSIFYALNEAGRTLMEKHLAISDASFARRLETLTEEERTELTAAMEYIVSILERF